MLKYTFLIMIWRFIKHLVNSFIKKNNKLSNEFTASFINNIISNRIKVKEISDIESVRNELLKSKKILKIEDQGAGSRINNNEQKTVKKID